MAAVLSIRISVINVRPYNQEEYNTSSPTEQF
jgi:hypothetical protein